MIFDSSALIALIMGEPGAERLQAVVSEAETVGIAAPTVVETAMVLSRTLQGDPMPRLI